MPQSDASYEPPNPSQQLPVRAAFPWERLILSAFFAFVAWCAFWVVLISAVVMWIMIAVSREVHPQFRSFVTAGARYVGQCLEYILMISDDKPFPLGPLPGGGA